MATSATEELRKGEELFSVCQIVRDASTRTRFPVGQRRQQVLQPPFEFQATWACSHR
jgi:hypothetical protein